MMGLTNSIDFFCFSAVFDPLIHMKTILIKKAFIVKSFWLQLQVCPLIHEFQMMIEPGIII